MMINQLGCHLRRVVDRSDAIWRRRSASHAWNEDSTTVYKINTTSFSPLVDLSILDLTTPSTRPTHDYASTTEVERER